MNIWKIEICYKLISTIKHLSVHFLRKTQLTIYESFVRPRLDYGDIVCGYGYIIYDNPVSESLINKLEKVQYQVYLEITDSLQGTV